MKRAMCIDGFNVEYIESVRDDQVRFTARIVDPYVRGAGRTTPEEAFSSLAERWEALKAAYLKSNLPGPKPQRSHSNKRMRDTLNRLERQPFPTSII